MKSLLFIVASLSFLTAGAQLKNADAAQPLTRAESYAEIMDLQVRAPGEAMRAPRQSSQQLMPFYRRPAGAFFTNLKAVDGVLNYDYSHECLMLKPYSNYTFHSIVDGADDEDVFFWNYEANGEDYIPEARDITVKYAIEEVETPRLTIFQNGSPSQAYSYHYPHATENGTQFSGGEPAHIISAPLNDTFDESDDEVEHLLSSKTMCFGGRYYGSVPTLYYSYSGATPHGENAKGWWFGKNAGEINGMAQVFEKPEHPYRLNKIYMMTGKLLCNSRVELKCKVYRLPYVPAYDNEYTALLFPIENNLIAEGYGVVTPQTNAVTGGLVEFLLYDQEDGLEFEIAPTIDEAIVVIIEGYNDPEADGLVDFFCYISADYQVDEGYGELAYVYYKIPDSGDQYAWMGLNNFFNIGQMKTGFTIFIVADYPFLVFNNPMEDGEYIFNHEGGEIDIELKSSVSYQDEDVYVTSKYGDEIPYWLHIELSDIGNEGEYNNIINAHVTADPMPMIPPGFNPYRDATVRFEISGAYIDYHFRQKAKKPCSYGGEITIATVNYLINLMLEGMYDDCYDFNDDGELTIADLNALIDFILNL